MKRAKSSQSVPSCKRGSGLSKALFLFSIVSPFTLSAKEIKISGSSTVFPVTMAVAEEFVKDQKAKKKNARPPVIGESGTGGGFKQLINKEIDIVNASRPVTPTEEEALKKAGVRYVGFKIGYDGLAVVTKKGSALKSLTMAELKKLWEPGSTVKKWSDLRAGLPAKPVVLYGPGTESGTLDFFSERVLNTKKQVRSDYKSSEDDNSLVTGIAMTEGASGFFGYSYYKKNESKLDLIAIDDGKGKSVLPSVATLLDGTYPLSRPLLVYVSIDSLKLPEVREFMEFYLNNVANIIVAEEYFALKPEESKKEIENFQKVVKGL